ncbi:MAG: hypothetical protein OQK24_12745 [Magnetovibrio sp.]|nr:hypothetical protein [Magnetovibrio sp.]
MKLLLCTECSDVQALSLNDVAICRCGKSRGKYLNEAGLAEFSGECAHLIGFNNSSFIDAIYWHLNNGDRSDGMGRRFEAFIIPEGAETAIRKND